jgi:tetratricopeptide (TPR) repeat protein
MLQPVARRGFLVVALMAAGCATRPPAPVAARPTQVLELPSTRAVDVRAELPLDDVPPRPQLRRPAASADSDRPPPIEAVQLFAQARIAILDNERYTAINLLEKAVALDPGSFELHEMLGTQYQGNDTSDDRSITAFENAAKIDPDHLDLQVNLGRQYLAGGKTSLGIEHLLLALQTTAYGQDDPADAEAELFLSNALEQQGYNRAALTLLERLSVRLNNPGMAMRAEPAMALLLDHPEEVMLRIGLLQQKRGHNAEALAAYQSVAQSNPSDVDLQGRMIEVLAAMGRHDEAAQRASDLMVQLQGRDPSLQLLRTAMRDAGGDLAVSEVLGRLYQQHPNIPQLLFDRVDLLHSLNRGEEADRALADAAAVHGDDLELAAHRFHALAGRGDRTEAARFIIQITARHPEWTPEATQLFDEILRPTSAGRLRLEDLRGLKLDASMEPARLYWIAHWASVWHRDGTAQKAIAQAVTINPVFAPAYREQLSQLWAQIEGAPTTNPSADALAQRAAAANPSLGAELRGLILLRLNQPGEAAQELAAAMKSGPSDAELALEHAGALSANGDEPGFESAMWKLLSDHPTYEDGYLALYGYYVARGSEEMNDRVLSTWLSADPDNVNALRLQARDYFTANRADAAEAILLRLLNRHADDPDVLGALENFYVQTSRPDALPQKLEQLVAHDPGNFAAIESLSDLYIDQHQPADAARILDIASKFNAADPDLLYNLSGLYSRNDQKAAAEQALRDVLRLDPTHSGASNDLGYFLSEEGRDLPEAEALIRRAVEAEPLNTAFLDSLGWVLYKRGRFAEAEKFLERATLPESDADPIVLNHLGDDLYRLGEKEAAARTWKKAGERLLVSGDDPQSVKGLAEELQQKQQELDAGHPVDVAPTTQPATPIGPQAEK